MNVLSLFDGMACGLVALKRAGIKVDNYYASEIDKWAIQVAKKNHPEIIHLGDIENYQNWDLPKIDLVIGGSPCQGFSFAGKQLNFDDPRSALFFKFVEILWMIQEKNPDVKFLMENVKMKKEYSAAISELLECEPVLINSALVSGQNRKRLYWCNWKVGQPDDKGILLKDIVFDDALFSYLKPQGNNTGGLRSINGKIGALTSNSWEHNNFAAYQFPHGCTKGGVRNFEKSPTVSAQFHNNMFPVCMHNLQASGSFKEKYHRIYIDKSPTIRAAQGGGHLPSLLHSKKAIDYMGIEVSGGRNHWDFKRNSDIKNRKSAAVVANFFKGVPYNVLKQNGLIRKFDPIECERLQTLPDNYTDGVSNTQRYKMIGNGWTVGVITHILKGLINPASSNP
jgi:DNA (cytosine-5)-methyltransferase 3A